MKRLTLMALLTLGCSALGPGFAAEPAVGQTTSSNEPQLEALPEPRRCLKDTGSRIKPADDGCLSNVVGRRYDRNDIESTGSLNLGEALMRLDPNVGLRGR